MSLTSNPFYVLGATPSDDRRRIVALANDKRLEFDSDEVAVREAQSILITPRKRLAAEIAWLPGVEAGEMRRALAAMDERPDAGLQMHRLPALARANLLADGLVRERSTNVSSLGLAEWIVELASAHEQLRPDEVTTAVNEARLVAGVPMASPQDVAEGLRGRRGHYRDAMEQCLDGLALSRMVEVVTSVVSLATQEGARHAPALIDNLVDSYYDQKVSEKMAANRKKIATLVSQVRGHVGRGTLARVSDVVAKIESKVREWDVLAQPIQVSLASRGMSHPSSNEIMREVRELAVELFNKHGLLEVAQGLTKTLREVFAEMEPITEVLDKDVSALDGIAKRVGAVQGHGAGAHASGSSKNDDIPWRWVAAIAILLFFAILIGIGNSSSSSNSGSNQDYSMPVAGANGVLNVSEIRWCLRQLIRIETWHSQVSTNQQNAAVSQIAKDYDERCTSRQFYEGHMTTAMQDVESQRTRIIEDARRHPPWRSNSNSSKPSTSPSVPKRNTHVPTSFVRAALGRWVATGRGSDVAALALQRGKYATTVVVVGNQGRLASVKAKQLGHGPFWLFQFGDSLRGYEAFSLASAEVLDVDVSVAQSAEWTIWIEKITDEYE